MRKLRYGFGLAILLYASTATAQIPQMINYLGRVVVDGTNFHGTGQFKFALVDGGTDVWQQATATATVAGGQVTAITVTDGGFGYVSAPAVTITDPFMIGTGAQAEAFVTPGGVLSSIDVTNPGSGYSTVADVTIDTPPPSLRHLTFWSNDGTSVDGWEPTAAVALSVNKGLFSVRLGDTGGPFGIPIDAFTNTDVRIRTWFDDDVSGSQLLSPDQRIAAVGYALIAASVDDGAINPNMLATDSVINEKIADGEVASADIAAGAVGTEHLAGSVSNLFVKKAGDE